MPELSSMNASSCYWSYIDFYTFSTYNYILTIPTQPPERKSQAATGEVLSFANFTGKHLCWSLLFTKLQAFRIATLLKKRPLHRCFPVKFEKFWRTPILKTAGRLLLCIDYFIIYWFLQSSTVHVFHFFFITQLKQ